MTRTLDWTDGDNRSVANGEVNGKPCTFEAREDGSALRQYPRDAKPGLIGNYESRDKAKTACEEFE